LAQQDSTKLSLSELKQIAGLLVELQARREQSITWFDKESIYKNIIRNYQRNENNYKQQINLLQENIETSKPAFYDRFWVGSAVTAIVFSIFILLSK
jgi:magnesium-transporting ATPase (P-type)